MEKILKLKNINSFYSRIYFYKLLSKFHIKIKLIYNNKEYVSSNIKHKNDLDTILKILDILNTPDKSSRYNLIYDYSCDYLDNEFAKKNLCGFKNNMCVSNRSKPKEYQVGSCCTRVSTGKTCEYFDESIKRCSIKCLGCKLFVCNYLWKKGIRYPINSIPYLKYFLSIRQKLITKISFFRKKEDIIKDWERFYKLP